MCGPVLYCVYVREIVDVRKSRIKCCSRRNRSVVVYMTGALKTELTK